MNYLLSPGQPLANTGQGCFSFSAYIIWNYYAGNFFTSPLLIYLFNHLCQYRFMIICFVVWIIILYYFINFIDLLFKLFSSLAIERSFQLTPVPLWHSPRSVFICLFCYGACPHFLMPQDALCLPYIFSARGKCIT